MPSGRRVTASVSCYAGYTDCFMRISVYALAVDQYISEGLCGNYDGDWTNDLTQGGLPPPSYSSEPIEFSVMFL